MTTLYNEIDPYPARWLENLIAAGHIPEGRVDQRSIADLTPGDCAATSHFFAGIGGWPHALRLAGWTDDRPVWTGSCPCQPWSTAGRGLGEADKRHLWPAWFRLIRECRPPVIFGEQVASPAGLRWLDLVSADLEGEGYAFGAADLCAASAGAPHIRQRLYFVAHTRGAGLAGWPRLGRDDEPAPERGGHDADELADSGSEGRQQVGANAGRGREGSGAARVEQRSLHTPEPEAPGRGSAGGLANTRGDERRSRRGSEALEGRAEPERAPEQPSGRGSGDFWTPCDWIPCRDGKSRPVEPGTEPLAHGVPGRVGKLRAYGNAIVPQVAATFIAAWRLKKCQGV